MNQNGNPSLTARNFDAARADGAALTCFYCEREIPGGVWFARIKLGSDLIAFCCPRCVELFLEANDHRTGRQEQEHSSQLAWN